MSASEIISQNQEVVAVDLEADPEAMAETEVEDPEVMVETEIPDLVEEMTDHGKCLMQNAEIVEMIAKYHSNQKRTGLFIVMSASEITDVSKLF